MSMCRVIILEKMGNSKGPWSTGLGQGTEETDRGPPTEHCSAKGTMLGVCMDVLQVL